MVDTRTWDGVTKQRCQGINTAAQLHLNWPKRVEDGTIDGLVVVPKRIDFLILRRLLSGETIKAEFSPYRKQIGDCRLYAFQGVLYYQMGLAEAAVFELPMYEED